MQLPGFVFTSHFLDDARSIERRMIDTRRELHSRPELAFKEHRTAAFVAKSLEKLGIEVRSHVGGTGVVGVLRGRKPGSVVALRADMDALPIQEPSGLAFASKNAGVMHACGHDSHMAMLLGAAEMLSNQRADLHGTIKFLFQPAEEAAELGGGAVRMIKDGALDHPSVDHIFGLHILTNYPSGTFGVRPGPIMAASGTFRIRIVGRGGHGSAPHQTVDPIFVSAQLISALQGIRGRMIDPVDPSVVSVCEVHSGTRNNIIPDDAALEGTMRTLSEASRKRVASLIPRIAKGVCRTYGAECEVEMDQAYPVTLNDSRTTEEVTRILRTMPGVTTLEVPPLLIAEDFSFFLRKVPGTYYFLGTRNEKKGCVYPNHSSKFKVDEDVLKYGAASLALLASEFSRKGK